MLRTATQAPATERGFAMVLVMFLVVVVSGLSFGLLQEGMAARTGLENHKSNMRALEIAEAGLVRAEMELRAQIDIDGDGIGNAQGAFGDGTYEVTIADDPASPDRWILTARGEHGHSARRVEVGVRRRTGNSLAEALFSMDDLPVSSVATDAYDSRLGTYASQATNVDGTGPYADTGGSLGSNGNINLDGSSVHVRGNAIPGKGDEVIVNGGPIVSGDMVPRQIEVELPPAPLSEFQDAMANNNNGGLGGSGNGNKVRWRAAQNTVSISGNTTVSFPAGTYFFKDFTALAGTVINVLGPVRIYIVGDFTIGSGTSIVAGSPSDVEILVHPYGQQLGLSGAPTETNVKISGGSQVTWSMYGPGASLDIGGGNDFYGAAIGKQIELNGNNRFHYDKALGDSTGDKRATLERIFWREINPPAR